MKTALFTSKNLIGDGLYIGRALNQWHRLNPDYEITLLTLKDHVTCIYSHMGIPLTIVTELPNKHFDFQFTFDVSRAFKICDEQKIHIAQAYAQMLGVNLPVLPGTRQLQPIFLTDRIVPEEMKRLVLVSMFSASCASREGKPPNKMLPWPKWHPILSFLRNKFGDNQLRFLGAPTDRAPDLPITEDEYYTGVPLPTLAAVMKESRFVFTVDNGMAHLAASQGVHQVVLYPACLGLHYITPIGNPLCSVIHMDPVTVQPSLIVQCLRKYCDQFKL